ncbi:ATP-binding protein [Roseimicrobium sp. ORNL1]|uniref:ATP-binding protein n=1 Tax=Roseimicrobium sp. ORNL1 TaxID=2711231 RepID=UPI0013E1CEF3|nr:ATP-binding protein [Roseimicrobium sp. ORNL1]QIF02425.1 hypothetical protein G5S37_13125 [Roseimicrobium sp. ORNL1]
MVNDAVRYSRAGDRFHYLWAARQCLELIDLRSSVEAITVEGSPEPTAAGELVIDVGKVLAAGGGAKSVQYFQLKHSTLKTSKHITFSELAHTMAGFAERFRHGRSKKAAKFSITEFSIISNRQVSPTVKNGFQAIAAGAKAHPKFSADLKKTTKLSAADLKLFCSAVSFRDDEGDYLQQERELKFEIAPYSTSGYEDTEVLKLVGMVTEHALPESKGRRRRGAIVREDVLKRLGVDHTRDLFPAPSAMESIDATFLREQHAEFIRKIKDAPRPVILHAPGGVGKSVVAQQLARSFPKGSVGIVYDCFGGGNYLNEAEPRHRACDALVQIANELSVQGLCRTLLANATTPRDVVIRSFLTRVKEACELIRRRSRSALLVILVDAADNAEMAADAANEPGFPQSLIRQAFPENCRVVFLCRTERRELLRPPTKTPQLPLKPFSLSETRRHLRTRFSKASQADGVEFFRLTGGNPRVQANCLAARSSNAREMLASLGPGRTTVDQQIAKQLDAAISSLRDQHTKIVAAQIDSICRGLATLPPFIPIPVLAAAANVDVDAVKSFISDLGRPLWHSDDSVQFRDEPVETWFRTTYAASKDEIRVYAEALEPLSSYYSYVARALPGLWHRAGDHDRLIAIALSDDYLPEENPIDVRDVRIFRLQYAFKTALRAKRLSDAAKVALRAGEEMAGNDRQLSLLRGNIDLMGVLQEPHRIQECAYKRLLKGGWAGAENAFAASLLSSHSDFHGEARNYLNSAFEWLHIHFEERKRLRKEHPHYIDPLSVSDVVELAWAELNLSGTKSVTNYICKWSPSEWILDITTSVVRRLVDAGRFKEIETMARHGAVNAHFIVGLGDELLKSSKLPPKSALRWTLDQFEAGKVQINRPNADPLIDYDTPAIVSFAEACAFHRLPSAKILLVLAPALTMPSLHRLTSDYDTLRRHTFSRAVALKAALEGSGLPDIKVLVPDVAIEVRQNAHSAEERQNARRMLSALLPLYHVRAQVLIGASNSQSLDVMDVKVAQEDSATDYWSSSRIDWFWDELLGVRLSVLALKGTISPSEFKELKAQTEGSNGRLRRLFNRNSMARTAYRHDHLVEIGQVCERSCVAIIGAEHSEEPEQRAGWFISLARAVLSFNLTEASAYFCKSIDAVSKFGDEILERWDAVGAIARRAGDDAPELPEVAYRFVRSAEMVGDTIAREKYWDRSEVFRIAVRLHAPSAFCALSRWRDRDVGDFPDELKALAIGSIQNGSLNHVSGFCVTGFSGPKGSVKLLRECIQREPNADLRQRIFDVFVEDAYVESELIDIESKLENVAHDGEVKLENLRKMVDIAKRTRPQITDSSKEQGHYGEVQEAVAEWVLPGIERLDLASVAGIAKAVLTLEASKRRWEHASFWPAVVDRIPRGREIEFLKAVVQVKQVGWLDMRHVLTAAREKWKELMSFQRHWPSVLRSVGRRFYVELAGRGGLDYWTDGARFEELDIDSVKHGIHEGIEEASALLDSGSLFGFVAVLAKRLSCAEARDVLNFALQRFEVYIDPDYADGAWEPWLQPPRDTGAAFAGLLWASLGAPDSGVRWEAAHCVRRLVEFGCVPELGALLQRINEDDVAAFLGKGHAFYPLHAQLYTLIGLSRGALNNVEVLIPHCEVFTRMALHSIPHALIQPLAAKLALAIGAVVPGTLTPTDIASLQAVGVSPFPLRHPEEAESFDSPFHGAGLVVPAEAPGFELDFDAYWLPSLASVFGVPNGQIDDLMRIASVSNLGVVALRGQHPVDTRREQWNSQNYYSRGTSHSHGSYPRVDTFDFYYSYHSLMIVASKLLAAMPVIYRYNDEMGERNRWREWVARHGLTRSDGRWLCDRRDPSLPSRKRGDTPYGRIEWLCGVVAGDFFEALTAQATIAGGLCISGSWHDGNSSRQEHFTVSSAFVRPEMQSSLANALRTAEHPNLVVTTSFEEAPESPFDLMIWIAEPGGGDSRLDAFDPHANKLSYPVRKVGPQVVHDYGLTSDPENRYWWCPGSPDPVVIAEAWSEGGRDERYVGQRRGERVFISVEFLKSLCKRYGRSLILLVQIHRYESRGGSHDDDGFSWLPRSHKVFIFSEDGLLKDSRTDHRIG